MQMSDDGEKSSETAPSSAGREKRYPVDWHVSFRCPDWATVSRVTAENASRGGLFLLTSRPPPVGAKVELTLSLPDATELKLTATVQHIITAERGAAERRNPGFGVRVDATHASDLVLLEAMAAAAQISPTVPATVVAEGTGPEDVLTEPPTIPRKPTRRPAVIGRHARGTGPAGRIAAVDLGTTYSSLAIAGAGNFWFAVDDEGRARHPSLVHYPMGPGEPRPIAGWNARGQLVADPRLTVAGARRLLGQKMNDPQVAGWLKTRPFRAVAGPRGEVRFDLEGASPDAAELCSALLRHLRGTAEQQLGRSLVDIVLTSPVGFGDAEQQALHRAAELADLRVIDLMPEPVAAALSVGAGQSATELVGVFDWGGGRFDFSLVEMAGGLGRVIGSAGDASISGDELDQTFAGSVAETMWRDCGVEMRRRMGDWQRLLLACEEARRTLVGVERTRITIDEVEASDGATSVTYEVERRAVEALTDEPLERAIACVRVALGRADLQADALDRLIVVGGLANLPWVRAEIGKRFARAIDAIVRPDEAIARGAATHAATLEARSGLRSARSV